MYYETNLVTTSRFLSLGLREPEEDKEKKEKRKEKNST